MSKTYDPQWENALTVGAPPHRHPSGPAFGYMLEGEMLFELEGEPPRVIRAGQAFREPGDDVRSRFVVTMMCVAGQPMLELVDDDELAARSHLRIPAQPDREE